LTYIYTGMYRERDRETERQRKRGRDRQTEREGERERHAAGRMQGDEAESYIRICIYRGIYVFIHTNPICYEFA
jgi:hypothetical protein